MGTETTTAQNAYVMGVGQVQSVTCAHSNVGIVVMTIIAPTAYVMITGQGIIVKFALCRVRKDILVRIALSASVLVCGAVQIVQPALLIATAMEMLTRHALIVNAWMDGQVLGVQRSVGMVYWNLVRYVIALKDVLTARKSFLDSHVLMD